MICPLPETLHAEAVQDLTESRADPQISGELWIPVHADDHRRGIFHEVPGIAQHNITIVERKGALRDHVPFWIRKQDCVFPVRKKPRDVDLETATDFAEAPLVQVLPVVERGKGSARNAIDGNGHIARLA